MGMGCANSPYVAQMGQNQAGIGPRPLPTNAAYGGQGAPWPGLAAMGGPMAGLTNQRPPYAGYGGFGGGAPFGSPAPGSPVMAPPMMPQSTVPMLPRAAGGLVSGHSPAAISKNIKEFHTGDTFKRTAEKFGKDRANKQADRSGAIARPRTSRPLCLRWHAAAWRSCTGRNSSSWPYSLVGCRAHRSYSDYRAEWQLCAASRPYLASWAGQFIGRGEDCRSYVCPTGS